VLLDGVEIVGAAPREVVRRGVARTFQNTQLFDSMTALENVMVGAQAHQGVGFVRAALRLPSARAEERSAREEAARLLRQVGIGAWADTAALDLPAGIRRLVEIARALATHPRLLLLRRNPPPVSTRLRPRNSSRLCGACGTQESPSLWSSTTWGS